MSCATCASPLLGLLFCVILVIVYCLLCFVTLYTEFLFSLSAPVPGSCSPTTYDYCTLHPMLILLILRLRLGLDDRRDAR